MRLTMDGYVWLYERAYGSERLMCATAPRTGALDLLQWERKRSLPIVAAGRRSAQRAPKR